MNRSLKSLLVAALIAAPTMAWAQDDVFAEPHIPGRLLVGFQPGAAAADVANAYGAAAVHLEQDLQSCQLVECDPGGGTLAQARAALLANPAVRYAEPDYILRADLTPNDPDFGQLYGMALIGAETAWDTQTGSSTVVVGIIDTGIDVAHPDLAANIWVNPGEIAGNGIDDDGNGYIDDVNGWDFRNEDNDPFDGRNHGTHVAGTVGAVGNNGLQVAGVCWNVRMAALKFLSDGGTGTTSDAIEAVNYAAMMGFPITCNSWGGGAFSQALQDAIESGGLFVAAAGNNGSSGTHYPGSYPSANIISVAATDQNDALASFSNYNATRVDLAAPGVGILSTVPGGGTASFDGTSMATPHVAGAAALLLSQAPSASAAQLKDFIMQTVTPVPALSGLMVTGGRLDVAAALAATNAAGTFRVEIEAATAQEDAGTLSFNVLRNGLTAGAVSVTVSTADGTALDGGDYTGASTTLSWADGVGGAQAFSVDLLDDGVLESDETFTISLSSPTGGAIFLGPTTTTVTIRDNDGSPGSLVWSAPQYEITEGDGPVVLTINRVGGDQGDVTVEVGTFPNTANLNDFSSLFNTVVTLAHGVTSQTVSVNIVDDPANEPDEDFFVFMENPTGGATLGTPEDTNVVIHDNDPLGASEVYFQDLTSSREESVDAGFQVRRAGNLAGTATVDWALVDGTATAPEDYVAASGTVSFSPGSTGYFFPIDLIDDLIIEPDETFTVVLSNPSGTTIRPGEGTMTITIVNDDESDVSFASASYSVGEGGGSIDVVVNRTGDLGSPVSVGWYSFDLTTTEGDDYTAMPPFGTLIFDIGETSQTISFPILDDTVPEALEELFFVGLEELPGGNAEPVSDDPVPVTIVDDDTFPPGQSLRFDQVEYTVLENAGTLDLTILREGGTTGTITGQFATFGLTTQGNGFDYTDRYGTFYFDPGETSQTISIPITNNIFPEPEELFMVLIENVTNGVDFTGNNPVLVVIQDDDSLNQQLGFRNFSETVLEGDTLTISVDRSSSTGLLQVEYFTFNVDATAGADYVGVEGTLTFVTGVTTRTITINTLPDGDLEGDEAFMIMLTNPTNGVTFDGPNPMEIVITDDD